jgi:hypothetical protein
MLGHELGMTSFTEFPMIKNGTAYGVWAECFWGCSIFEERGFFPAFLD